MSTAALKSHGGGRVDRLFVSLSSHDYCSHPEDTCTSTILTHAHCSRNAAAECAYATTFCAQTPQEATRTDEATKEGSEGIRPLGSKTFRPRAAKGHHPRKNAHIHGKGWNYKTATRAPLFINTYKASLQSRPHNDDRTGWEIEAVWHCRMANLMPAYTAGPFVQYLQRGDSLVLRSFRRSWVI